MSDVGKSGLMNLLGRRIFACSGTNLKYLHVGPENGSELSGPRISTPTRVAPCSVAWNVARRPTQIAPFWVFRKWRLRGSTQVEFCKPFAGHLV
jgi:hypothetical protein